VVSNFIVQALQGRNISIYCDGQQTRSFCYVTDLISGFVKMTDTDTNIVGPLNLGNPEGFTIKELAVEVLRLTDSKSQLIYLPLPSDDALQRKPDITKAREKLNWDPAINLCASLKETISYFEKIIREQEVYRNV
jgi:UDP-glucuronate decarboxylase